MAYDLAYLRERVKNKLDDDDFDSNLIDVFLNDTQREILNTYELPFNESTFSGTLTVGEHSFDLDATTVLFQRILSLRITAPSDTEIDLTENFIPYREFRKLHPDPTISDNRKPHDWTIFGNKIYFSTPIDQAYTMDMDFVEGAATMEDDTDAPVVPEEFQETLILGAYIRALERNDDNDIAEYQRTKRGGYVDQVATMVNRYSPSQTAVQTVMRNSRRRSRHDSDRRF